MKKLADTGPIQATYDMASSLLKRANDGESGFIYGYFLLSLIANVDVFL